MGSVNEKLWKGVDEADEEFIKACLDNGADVNNKRDRLNSGVLDIGARSFWTPLHSTAFVGHASIVVLLLKNGADVNARVEEMSNTTEATTSGPSALHFAAAAGHADVVKALLDYGADVNAQRTGWTALGLAFIKGHKKIVQMLLDHGANLTRGSETALHFACASGDSELVEALITRGVDLNARCTRVTSTGDKERNLTPLHYACEKGHLHIVKILLRNSAVRINAKAIRQTTAHPKPKSYVPLTFAKESGFAEVVEYLEARGGELPLDDEDDTDSDDSESRSEDVQLASVIRQFDGVRAKHQFLRKNVEKSFTAPHESLLIKQST